MIRRARVAGWLPVIAAALALGGDAPDRGRTLRRLVPGLDHDAAFHLIHDTPGELLDHCRAMGPVVVAFARRRHGSAPSHVLAGLGCPQSDPATGFRAGAVRECAPQRPHDAIDSRVDTALV